MKIENIDTTLEEIQEVGEQMRVINEAISQPVGGFQVRETVCCRGFICTYKGVYSRGPLTRRSRRPAPTGAHYYHV